MKSVKRIEIILEALHEAQVIESLDRAGIRAYTLYHHLTGSGERGQRQSNAFGDKFENLAFVIACDAEKLDALVTVIRPILKMFGGICLISDAVWLRHNEEDS